MVTVNVTDTCEECFADISVALRTAIEAALGPAGPLVIPGTDIEIDAIQ